MGVLYSIAAVTDETRTWFAQHPDVASSLPTDEQIRQVVRELPSVSADYSVEDDEVRQVRLQRGDEHTVLNVFRDDAGRRHMYFEKGWFTLVFDFTAELARFSGPLIVVADSDSIPLLIPARGSDDEDLKRHGYVTNPPLFGDPPRSILGFLKRTRPRERRMLVGALPRVEPELVRKLGLKAESDAASFYALNGDGDVVRVFMTRVRGEPPPPPEVVLKLGLVREPGYVYMIDKNGDLQRMKQR